MVNTSENLTRMAFRYTDLQERNSLFSSIEHHTATCKIEASKPLLLLLHRKAVTQQLYSSPDLTQPSPKPFPLHQQLSKLTAQPEECMPALICTAPLSLPAPGTRGSHRALPFVAACRSHPPSLPPRPPHTARVTPSPSKGKWPPDHRSWAGWRKPQVR